MPALAIACHSRQPSSDGLVTLIVVCFILSTYHAHLLCQVLEELEAIKRKSSYIEFSSDALAAVAWVVALACNACRSLHVCVCAGGKCTLRTLVQINQSIY